MADVSAPMRHGPVELRLIRTRDARPLQHELVTNRRWLQPWEATLPGMQTGIDMRVSIRRLLQQYRDGSGYPFVMEYDGRIAGQLNIWGVMRGSLCSATIGYWVSERFAGHGITPASVALATDLAFTELGLHRIEICMRPENRPSLRVVQKLGFRYEGLRRRFIHIDGDWRDHLAFSLVREDVPEGVLHRWATGRVPADWAAVPASDLPGTPVPAPVPGSASSPASGPAPAVTPPSASAPHTAAALSASAPPAAAPAPGSAPQAAADPGTVAASEQAVARRDAGAQG